MTLIDDGFTDNDASITNNFPANDPVEATWTFPDVNTGGFPSAIANQQLEVPIWSQSSGNTAVGTASSSATLSNVGDKVVLSADVDLSGIALTDPNPPNDALRFGLFDSNGSGYVALTGVGANADGRFQVRTDPSLYAGSFTNPAVSSDFNLDVTSNSIEFTVERVSADSLKLTFTPGTGSGFSATIDHSLLSSPFDSPVFTFDSVLFGHNEAQEPEADPMVVDNVSLIFMPIPEPSSLVLIAVGGVLVLARRGG